MDDRLTDIENDDRVAGESACKFCCESGLVMPGKMDEECLA